MRKVQVQLPKFKFEFDVPLQPVLEEVSPLSDYYPHIPRHILPTVNENNME